MAIIAAVVGAVVSAGIGVGLSAALAPGAPKNPNLGEASRAGVEANAETLADRRRLEAAAQQGISTTYQIAGQKATRESRPFVALSGGAQHGTTHANWVPYVESEWAKGGKYNPDGTITTPQIVQRKTKVEHPAGTRTADFTGYGEADVQGKIARQMADVQLELAQKYGPAFAEEARKQLELADPEGTMARDKQFELIQQMIDAQPDRPVATLLDEQVASQLASGKQLGGMSDQMLREAVAQANADRGQGGIDPTRYDEPLTMGFAGQQRLDAAQQKALGWLSSGATPEDVKYRRDQQNNANLSAMINGETPVSQFRNLSGAQQGTTPFMPGNPLPNQSNNGAASGQQAAMQGWDTQQHYQLSQANPWMAGLSMLLSGAGAAGNAGWQPLAGGV